MTIFLCIYISLPSHDLYIQHRKAVAFIYQRFPSCRVIICGDINIPGALRSNDDLDLELSCKMSSPFMVLRNCYGVYNMYQFNTVANSRNVFLDLVFSNHQSINVELAIDLLLPNNVQHNAILTRILCQNVTYYLQFENNFFDFCNANYIGMNYYFSTLDWNFSYDLDVDRSVPYFYNILHYAIENILRQLLIRIGLVQILNY